MRPLHRNILFSNRSRTLSSPRMASIQESLSVAFAAAIRYTRFLPPSSSSFAENKRKPEQSPKWPRKGCNSHSHKNHRLPRSLNTLHRHDMAWIGTKLLPSERRSLAASVVRKRRDSLRFFGLVCHERRFCLTTATLIGLDIIVPHRP